MNIVTELKTDVPISKQEQIHILKMLSADLDELLKVVREWDIQVSLGNNEIH